MNNETDQHNPSITEFCIECGARFVASQPVGANTICPDCHWPLFAPSEISFSQLQLARTQISTPLAVLLYDENEESFLDQVRSVQKHLAQKFLGHIRIVSCSKRSAPEAISAFSVSYLPTVMILDGPYERHRIAGIHWEILERILYFTLGWEYQTAFLPLGFVNSTEDDNKSPSPAELGLSSEDIVERLEVLEDRFGITLEGLYVKWTTDTYTALTINGEVRSANGPNLQSNFQLIADCIDEQGRVVKSTRLISCSKDDFFGFATWDHEFFIDSIEEAQSIRRVRLYPRPW